MSKFLVQSELVTLFFVITVGEDGAEVKNSFTTEVEAQEFATKAEFGAEIKGEVDAFLNTNKLFGRRRAGTETIASSVAAFLKTWNGEPVEFDHEAAAAEAKAVADAAKAAEDAAKAAAAGTEPTTEATETDVNEEL